MGCQPCPALHDKESYPPVTTSGRAWQHAATAAGKANTGSHVGTESVRPHLTCCNALQQSSPRGHVMPSQAAQPPCLIQTQARTLAERGMAAGRELLECVAAHQVGQRRPGAHAGTCPGLARGCGGRAPAVCAEGGHVRRLEAAS